MGEGGGLIGSCQSGLGLQLNLGSWVFFPLFILKSWQNGGHLVHTCSTCSSQSR